jgi:gamma-glutamylcyclotransferase (GGCT)/AIG2-like uncharacterized protein YtfP
MKHKVLVYGSLKKGFGNHPILRDSEYLGEAQTLDSKYSMISLGGFPGLIDGNHRIEGELYEVDEDTFHRLDMLEGNGSFYQRYEVETSSGVAWMYSLIDKPRYTISKDDVKLEDDVESWHYSREVSYG